MVAIGVSRNPVPAVPHTRPQHRQRKPQIAARGGVRVCQNRPRPDRSYITEHELDRVGVDAGHGGGRHKPVVDPVDVPVQEWGGVQRAVNEVEPRLGEEDVQRDLEEELFVPDPGGAVSHAGATAARGGVRPFPRVFLEGAAHGEDHH